jgi:hypothetical protein
MAFIFESDDKQIAYGLKWGDVTPGRGESGRVADLGSRFNATHKLVMSVDGKPHYGFLESGARIKPKTKKGSIVSAAALFASLVPAGENSILVYTFENKKKAAIIALIGGVVYQDIILSLGAGIDRSDGTLRDDGTFDPDSNTTLAIVSDRIDAIHNETGQDFVPYGNYYVGFPESKEMTPETLLGGNVFGARIVKFTDARGTIKIAVVSLILMSMFGGYKFYQNKEKARKEREAMQNQVNPMDLYRSNIAPILARLRFTGPMAESALLNPMLKRDIDQAGWLMSEALCDKTGTCAEKWASLGGTNDSFVATNKVGEAAFNPDLKALSNRYIVPVAPAGVTIAELPTQEAFWKQITTQAQNYAASEVAMKIAPVAGLDFALPPGVTIGSVTPGMGLARAEFEMQGPLGFASDALRGLPANVMVEELKFTVSENLESNNFSVKGFYYVKK